jgi:hypothetical protein
MFSGKYKSISTVVENILRDTDYYNEINLSDAVEWAARAMELIGAPLVDTIVPTTLTIADFRATLPDAVKSVVAIRDNETKVSLIHSNDSFITNRYEEIQDGDEVDEIILPQYAYNIVNGYIFFNKKDGDVDILYTTFPTDDNGCLLIPDVDRYMMAVEAYIIYKIDNKMYRRGILARNIRDESEQNWLWYVNSAFTKLATPNYDEAESLKNQMLKIRTDQSAHEYGFEYLNTPTVKNF